MSDTPDETPHPAGFADRGQTACSSSHVPNSKAPRAPRAQRAPTSGTSSEASIIGKSTYEHKGQNVKSNALSGACQEFAGDLNFAGRSPRSGTEQTGDTRSQSAAPQPTGDTSQASVLQFFEHQSKQDSSYKHDGNNYLSNILNGSYQRFGGSLNFSD